MRHLARSAARLLTLLALPSALGAAPSAVVASEASPGAPSPADTGAVVYVDGYGVSHIFGPTDRSVLYASAWVQANADWRLVEENFTRSIGRAAEFLGDAVLADDYLARALEIPRLSKEEYEHASPRLKGLLDAYANGFNDWLAAHPERRRWLDHVEPWYPLALLRFKYHQLEFLGYAGFRKRMETALLDRGWPVGSPSAAIGEDSPPKGSASPAAGADAPLQRSGAPPQTDFAAASLVRYAEAPGEFMGERHLGSNEWALAPSKTADGHAMLLVNPHQSFFGVQRYFEIHLHSDEGMVFSGLTRFGFVLPYMGNNERLGWAFTDNYADIGDLYVEHFTDPTRPLAYRYGTGWRQATTWSETVKVKTGGTVGQRVLRFWKTHHGPVVGLDATGRPLAARLAKLEEGGWAAQLDAMIGSASLAEFQESVSKLAIPYMNLMYADADGNIWYLYNSAVAKRDPSFDWSKPVDGSDPKTEWQGYHAMPELPQVLNPESGFLFNTNSAPMVATVPAPFIREDFPSYMIGDETDNVRAQSSRRALQAMHEITFDRFARSVWDTHLAAADALVPALEEKWRALEAASAQGSALPPAGDLPEELAPGSRGHDDLAVALPRLAAWDREARIESVETTWFQLAVEVRGEMERTGEANRWTSLVALARALDALRTRWGTLEVPWGQVNRLQRPPEDDAAHFTDSLPSLPVAGASGAVFAFYPVPRSRTGRGLADRHYGADGNSLLLVIDFGPEPTARSVSVFGQSADPASPHFFDQGPLYAQRMFKPAWFTRADVEAHAVETYRPGPGAGR